MFDFFNALTSNIFLQRAVFASLLSGLSLGITGTFVVIKRISTISGALAHAVLGGVGIAYYFGYSPISGAFVFAILSAVVLGFVKIKAKQHEDTVIAALWAIGMSVGVIFMYITPGYQADLLTYLFGNILLINPAQLYTIAGLDVFVLFIMFLFYRQFVSLSFDEEYSKLRGIKVNLVYILLLCLIAVTIVVLIQIVGLILVIALLSLPASISEMFSKNIFPMMIIACLLSILFAITGLIIAYPSNLPPGAVIVILSGLSYLIALIIKNLLSNKYKTKLI